MDTAVQSVLDFCYHGASDGDDGDDGGDGAIIRQRLSLRHHRQDAVGTRSHLLGHEDVECEGSFRRFSQGVRSLEHAAWESEGRPPEPQFMDSVIQLVPCPQQSGETEERRPSADASLPRPSPPPHPPSRELTEHDGGPATFYDSSSSPQGHHGHHGHHHHRLHHHHHHRQHHHLLDSSALTISQEALNIRHVVDTDDDEEEDDVDDDVDDGVEEDADVAAGAGVLAVGGLGGPGPGARGPGSDSTSGIGSEDRESSCSSPRGCWKGAAAAVCVGEELFEAYGDDASLGPPGGGALRSEPRSGEHTSSLPASPVTSPRRWLSLFPHAAGLAIYCSRCSRSRDTLHHLQQARQLLSCSVLSSTTDSTEDFYLADRIDSPEIGFGEKVSLLENKVLDLELQTVVHGDQQTRLKQHNLQLVHRVHALEEAVREGEERSEERLEQEERRCRERTVRAHREAEVEMDNVASRLLEAEEENEELKMSIPRLRSQIEKLEEEKTRLQEKLRELLTRLQEEGRLSQQLAARIRRDRREFQRETEETQALVEDLRRELLHQQQLRHSERWGPGGWGAGGGGRTPREGELEGEVRRLRQENVKLKESNEELNGQLVGLGLHEAKGLLSAAAKSQSLAAEIDSASRGQLMDALKELEGINFHLRQYMDKIILAIIDHSPSILEIRR